MELTKVEVINFRNYEHATLNFKKKFNVLHGFNGQGKSNLLEAIYYLSTNSSFRSQRDNQIIRWKADFFQVTGQVKAGNNRNIRIQHNYLASGAKTLIIDGVKQDNLRNSLFFFNVVLFAPEDVLMVKGGPSLRRRFIDDQILQVNPGYERIIVRYRKSVMQRNNLLKKIRQHKEEMNYLELWDRQVAEYGSQIIIKRMEAIRKMQPLARGIQHQITDGEEDLQISYISSVLSNMNIQNIGTLPELVNGYLKHLKETRQEDIIRGQTLLGPHRDDLKFAINNIDLRIYGSQGQQRTTALALKMAQIEHTREETGEQPVLLLDDVFSELDDRRRDHLISAIQGKIQTFVTATNPLNNLPGDQTEHFEVEGGHINT
ncbi:MAG: DNA replication/repair protein RecF [Bacillota bacterium]